MFVLQALFLKDTEPPDEVITIGTQGVPLAINVSFIVYEPDEIKIFVLDFA